MNALGKWCFWIGLMLIVISGIARVFNAIPVTVVGAILSVLLLSMAAYDWLYSATERAELRRRAAKVKREQRLRG